MFRKKFKFSVCIFQFIFIFMSKMNLHKIFEYRTVVFSIFYFREQVQLAIHVEDSILYRRIHLSQLVGKYEFWYREILQYIQKFIMLYKSVGIRQIIKNASSKAPGKFLFCSHQCFKKIDSKLQNS